MDHGSFSSIEKNFKQPDTDASSDMLPTGDSMLKTPCGLGFTRQQWLEEKESLECSVRDLPDMLNLLVSSHETVTRLT